MTFDDGICGTIDMADLVQKGIFAALQQGDSFRNVTTDDYSISWSDELEIDAANIYAEIADQRSQPSDFILLDFPIAT